MTIGERWAIRSAQLGAREIIVGVPRSYSDSTRRFPVYYVLDGGEYFVSAVAATRAIATSGRAPDAIVVAIVNGDRGHDFTPPLVATSEPPPGAPRPGGADAFLGFLERDVIPFVDAKYRTAPLRVLIGHSLGGLLAVHAMTTRPHLFRGYVTLEPALWWDAGRVARAALDSLRSPPSFNARLTAVEGASIDGWEESWQELQRVRPEGLRVGLVRVGGESHETMYHRGVYDGLVDFFSDYMPAMRHDLTKATLADLEAQYRVLSRDFGFEVRPPPAMLLSVANREINQRRFDAARRVLARADSLFPGSRNVAEYRAVLVEQEAAATARGLGPVKPAVPYSPVTRAEAAPFLGRWSSYTRVEPGTPTRGTVDFTWDADTLFATGTGHGVAIDGGNIIVGRAPVEVRGRTLR